MRLRKVKNAIEILSQDKQYFVLNPSDFIGKWNEVFKNDNEINIEVGCGKGQFITKLATDNPDKNYVAIEKFDSVLVRTLEKCNNFVLPNLRIILYDALNLGEVFNTNEITNIYLNFSDPWPKTRHAKRRLTSSDYLNVYDKILVNDGCIVQKTDNRGLFEYSLESFSQNKWYISNIYLDLHKEKDIYNARTEFEDKWSLLGPIYKLEARKNPNME